MNTLRSPGPDPPEPFDGQAKAERHALRGAPISV